MILQTIVILAMAVVLFCVYKLIRNERVYNFRTRLHREDYESYKKLPSYQEMMDSFKPITKKNFCK